MRRLAATVAGLIAATGGVGDLGGLEPAGPGSSIRCSVEAVTLERPAYMVVNAVVRDNRLLLPDYTSGLREIDLGSGADRRSVLPMGTKRGQVSGPQTLGCGDGRCVVLGDRYFWIYYTEGFELIDEVMADRTGAGGQPLVFADRMVVAGVANPQVTGGGVAFLFVQYDDGSVVPLQEYPATMPVPEIAKRIHFCGPTAGGVERLAGGGWLFVDPRTYGVFVFDRTDRLVRAWRGANPRFVAPNFAAYEPVHDASGREYHSRWNLAQPQVKRPVALTDDLVGFVIGIPDGELRQRHELDVYRLDGTPVAIGVELPGVAGGRVIVADAGPGRLVVVGQSSWEPGSPTTAWKVTIEGLDS
ncbi:MAG: hypothetical protein MUC56_10630 [Thermoanaerobaculales bacterium]|jgi:hypothetical protein|nr:hypothetical protein [Thermoanaerobaculales bacterium]